MRVVTSSQMKQIEQNAADGGLPFLDMMENAGAACAEHIVRAVAGTASILIVCGKGKNGGDGFVIARHLCQNGFTVEVLLANGLPQADDAKTMFARLNGVTVLDWQQESEAASARESSSLPK